MGFSITKNATETHLNGFYNFSAFDYSRIQGGNPSTGQGNLDLMFQYNAPLSICQIPFRDGTLSFQLNPPTVVPGTNGFVLDILYTNPEGSDLTNVTFRTRYEIIVF